MKDKSRFEEYKKVFLEENSKHNLISKNDEKFLWEKLLGLTVSEKKSILLKQ